MHTGAARLTQAQAQAYLDSLEALASELETATDAIVAGALPTLEESVARQQTECTKLIAWSELMAARKAHQDSQSTLIDAEFAERIVAASSILLKLNRRYSALLKHSGDTLRLLTRLRRGYRGHNQPANIHTWSCEL